MIKFKKILKTILFWLVSFTWGLPLTLIGTFGALYMLITGHKAYRYGYFIYFVTNTHGCAFEGGPFFFVSGDCRFNEQIKAHEVGHGSIQNWVFGPLTVFVCTIPGVVRFWYRKYLKRIKGKKESDLPPYESIWFERTATEWGLKFVDIMKKSEVL